MFVVYQTITRGASWFAAQIDQGLVPCNFVGRAEPAIGSSRSLITDGVIAGVGASLFSAYILLLFFLALLEDCGYMAGCLCDGQADEPPGAERQVVSPP